MNQTTRNDVLAVAILTSVVTLLFVDILAGRNALYLRDIVHYAYPHQKILRDVVQSGEFPYWNRMFSAGQPLAANPAHEAFYPLTWLVMLPSYDYGFQLFILIHIYLAAWAMYALLRSLDLGPPSALIGALSFALGGVFLSYLTLLPLLVSAAWIPLVCLFARRFLLHSRGRDFSLAALALSMQLLVGEPTTVLQTAMMIGLYALVTRRWKGVAIVALIGIAALLVSAVAVLPGIDHARDSVRARGFAWDVVTDWSMPAVRAAELVYPNILGHNLLNGRKLLWGGGLYGSRQTPFLPSMYPGMLVAVLAIAGAFARVRGRGLFLALSATSILLALGAHTPLWKLLYSLGLVQAVRYPEKFILTATFAMAVFAAITLDQMLRGDERVQRMATRVALVITLFAAGWMLLALTPLYAEVFAAMWSPPRRLFTEMVATSRSGWVLAVARGVLLLVLLRTLFRARRALWLTIATVFVILDLGMLLPEMAARTSASYLNTPPAILHRLPPNTTEYRLFHHAARHRSAEAVQRYFRPDREGYWIYRNAAMPLIPASHGVQTGMDIDFDLTALLPTTDFMEVVWALSNMTPEWLEATAWMSNVWYRAVWIDPKIAFARAHGEYRLIEPVGILRMARAPRYWFPRRLEPIRDKEDFVRKLASRRFGRETVFLPGPSFIPAPGVVRRVRETANTARIEVETAGRSFLYMSVTPHKYWRITIDGAEAEAVVTNVGYQGVVVPTAGRHVVEMRYRNPLIAAGAAISLASLLALAFITMRRL